METIMQSYWGSMIIAILATSLFLSVLNRFKPLKNTHDSVLVAAMAFVFTLLTTSFSGIGSLSDVQSLVLKMLITAMVSYVFSVTKGQDLVDKLIDAIMKKASDEIDSQIKKG